MMSEQAYCECCQKPLKPDEGKVCHACERRVNAWLRRLQQAKQAA